MATFIDMPPTGGKTSVVDDFAFSSNVAGADVYVRLAFLRKVYGILSIQLLTTTLICAAVLLVDGAAVFLQNNPALVLVSAVLSFGLLLAMMVKSREFPINFYLLGAFTVCESLLVAHVVTFYEVAVVIEAFVLTIAVTTALTVYTFQSKRDYSHWGAGLFSALWILLLAGIMQIFLGSPGLEHLLAVGGALLFSLFIIFDTSMIMTKVSPEEYIHAAISLYLDIINLFLHILRILGEARRK